ncbi:hypothetical protein TTHERM_00348310 (macronuclear) [Tetrahymena thermophila SB210]|uniref:Uncharacterized protein n=1 Tax=Tetrahymena thermophila (strain SB210) TaxID=312017 RepID=I7MHA1_TETTS|nr:hypothetical protein TTHERM_00348310 [Tetrahymena thermophila SB210]EAS02741.2 hypothetical protein TTHERM_00348310 [Tetrahymena thermophila SB210]|eukprot:XP_001022986.2 hypothetical protein TTHERM_00348310 [Tetrahymena thermophila SB210]
MIFTSREAAPKQPNFRIGIQFDSVECQQGFENKIYATFIFTSQELAKMVEIPMESPLLFDVFKEDYKQKLEVELYENNTSIGQIGLRFPARPDYINEIQMEDIVNVDVNDHIIKIKYKFSVLNKLISAQKENNYKKRYNSNNKRDNSFEKQQQHERSGQELQKMSQHDRSDNKKKNTFNKAYMSENSENLPPLKCSLIQNFNQQNKLSEGMKQNCNYEMTEYSQKISFEETINKILQENSQYTNMNYLNTNEQNQNFDYKNQKISQTINAFETSRVEDSQSDIKIYSFQQNNLESQQNNVFNSDKSYSFSQQTTANKINPKYSQHTIIEAYSAKKFDQNLISAEKKRLNFQESPGRNQKNFQNLTHHTKLIYSPRSDIKSARKNNIEFSQLNVNPANNPSIGPIDTTRTSKSQEIQCRSRRSLNDITSASRNNRLETQNDSILEKNIPNAQGMLIDTLRQPYDISLCANSKDLDEFSQSQAIEYLKNLTVALQLRVQHLKHVESENITLKEDFHKLKNLRDQCLKTSENISQVSLQETVKLQQELEGIIQNSRKYLEQLKESRQQIDELKSQLQNEQNEKRQLNQKINELTSQIQIQSEKEKLSLQNINLETIQNTSTLDQLKTRELKEILEKIIREKSEITKENLSIKNDNIKLQQSLMELRLKYEELDFKNKQLSEQIILMSNGEEVKEGQDITKDQQYQVQKEINRSLILSIEQLHEEKNTKQREFNNLSSQYEEQILFLQKNVQDMEAQLRELNQTNLELQANNLELSLTLKNIECIQKSKQIFEEDLRKEIERNSTLYLQFQSIKQSNEVLFHKLVRANEQIKCSQDQLTSFNEQIKTLTQCQETAVQYLTYLSFLINDSYSPDQNDLFDKLLNEQVRQSKFSALIFIILRKLKSGLYQFGSQKIQVYIEENIVKVKGQDSAVKYFERNINPEILKLISSLNADKEKQYNELVLVLSKWLENKNY